MKPQPYPTLCLLALAAYCSISCSFDNRLRLPPDVSPIGHATLASCSPNATDTPRSCLMLTSPQKQQLWAVDMQTGGVVPANNRFFPVTVPLQAFASRLAAVPHPPGAPPSLPFVWALDGTTGRLLAVPIQGEQTLANQTFAFSSTQKPAADVALFTDATQQTKALITLPQQQQLQILPINSTTGVADANAAFSITVGSSPQQIAIDNTGKWAVMTDSDSTNVQLLPLTNLSANSSVQSLDVGHPTRLVTIGNAQLAPQQPLQTIAMVVGDLPPTNNNAQTQITWIHLQPDTGSTILANLKIQNRATNSQEQTTNNKKMQQKIDPNKGFVQAIYMPAGKDILPCCGHTTENQKPWAAVATTNGTLMYIVYDQSQLHINDKDTIAVSDKNQLGPAAVNPVAFVGGELILPPNSLPPNGMCKRQMFLVYPSLVASFCEGSSSLRRL